MIHGLAFTIIVAVIWPLALWLWAKNRVNQITRARQQTHQVAHDSVMRTIHKCETTVLMQKSQPTDAHKVSA